MFEYRNNQLYIENTNLQDIAQQYGTPCYVYSLQKLHDNWNAYATALQKSGYPHQAFYAVKANSNLAILNILHKLGASFDAVSGGEIERILAAGGKPKHIIFSGVGKSSAEITQAIQLEIHSINIESTEELVRVHQIAKSLGKTANIAFRINPDVSIDSHPYIATGSHSNKFGIDHTAALEIYKYAAALENIKICGISCHIGSQITTLDPFVKALDQVLSLVDQLAQLNIHLNFLDIGGGLGIKYKDENPPTPSEYVTTIVNKLKGRDIILHIEPGRSIVANAGMLLTKVEYLKNTGNNNFAIVDAAMNDLIRPTLYESYHEVIPVSNSNQHALSKPYAIVGPVCETGDFLANNRNLAINSGDLLAIKDCGAYGFSMSSNYNTRPRCAEVLVSNNQTFVIRERETIQQLLQNEKIIDVNRSI